MGRTLRAAAGVAALTAIASIASASPPPTHLPNQTILGLKIASIYIFPFHAGVNCEVSDPAHLGGLALLAVDYYYPAGAPTPFGHLSHQVVLPANSPVDCGFGHMPNSFYHVDHIRLTVTRGRRREWRDIPIGW